MKNSKIKSSQGWVKCCKWRIPSGYVLVRESIFGNRKVIEGNGLHFISPFSRGKVIRVSSVVEGLDDSDKITAICKEGYEVTIDPSITTKVIDVLKYEENEDAEKELTSILQSYIRSLITRMTFQELNDITIYNNDKRFGPLRECLNAYEEEYGLRLESLRLQNVKLSQGMQEAIQKKATQQTDNEVNMMAAKNRLKVAKIDADKTRIEGGAKTDVDLERLSRFQQEAHLNPEQAVTAYGYGKDRKEKDVFVTVNNSTQQKPNIGGQTEALRELKKYLESISNQQISDEQLKSVLESVGLHEKSNNNEIVVTSIQDGNNGIADDSEHSHGSR